MVAFRSVQREEMEGQRRLARFAKCLTEPSPDLRRLWENASAKAYSLHWSSPNDHSGLAGVLYTGFIVRLWSQFVVSPSFVSKASKGDRRGFHTDAEGFIAKVGIIAEENVVRLIWIFD